MEVRQAAASALGSTRLPEALPYLTVALRDSFWWFEREGAVTPLLEAFLVIGQPSVAPLLEALEDTEGTVRRFAATLLGRLGADRAAYIMVLFPIVALAMSTAFENFHWTMTTAVGIALVLLGNLLTLIRLPRAAAKLEREA